MHPDDSNSPLSRTQLETKLAGLYNLLEKFKALLQQRDATWHQYDHMYIRNQSKWGVGSYFLWVLICTIGFTLIAIAISAAIVANWAISADSEQPPFGAVALYLLPLPLALILSTVIVLSQNRRTVTANQRIDAQNEETRAWIIETVTPEIHAIQEHITAARREYQQHYGGWFPDKYRNAEDVAACWHIVHDGRAETVKEAINTLIEDQHRQYMQDAAAAQHAEQQRATRVAQVNGVINASMQGAMIGTLVDQGNRTRATLRAPVNVRVKR